MAAYRFRVTFEENDEVYRDIEIKSTQTFYDLHVAILASVSFEDNCDAAFFISDDVWRRGDEIALHPRKEESKKSRVKKVDPPKYMMKNCKLAALIDDPHQKFIYIQDPDQQYVFTVELMKIIAIDPKINYPKCSKSVGIAPKKIKQQIVLPDLLEGEILDDDIGDDEEAYTNVPEEVYDDEDKLDNIEDEDGENEGEESEHQEDEFGGFGDAFEDEGQEFFHED